MNSARRPIEERVSLVLARVGLTLQISFDATELDLGDVPDSALDADDCGLLLAGAHQVGVFLKESSLTIEEVVSLLREGYPVIVVFEDDSYWVLESLTGKRVEASLFDGKRSFKMLRLRELRSLLSDADRYRAFVAKKELECDTLSGAGHGGHSEGGHGGDDGHGGSAGHSGHGHNHAHPKPLRRFLSLLRLDARDVWMVVLFALVAGVLSLATPLAIESLVNVVSWGTFIQPLLVLGAMLLACLGLAGILKIFQTIVVELVQRRQLVRIVGDLSYRLSRADQASLHDCYPRELANRAFDIMTIQKASSVLLMDGISIVLTTVIGLVLLAFYHPFLLGFDIALVLSMIVITLVLGRGGIRSAIDESITKYRIAHWLQDIISAPAAFNVNGGGMMAVERGNRLVADYITARQVQFRVILRQISFAIILQVVASSLLLGLGGWLVMRQQLTLGQLVASELIVTVVVGAFAKGGKSLEKFYDLMAGVDKVGHLLDIEVNPRFELGELPDGPAGLRWEELSFHFASTGSDCVVPAREIPPGARVSVTGNDRSGKSLLLKSLAGLASPSHGMAEIAGYDARRAAHASEGRLVGYASRGETFHATLAENIDLGRFDIGQNRVREVLVQVGLWDNVLNLPNGARTMLQTDGAPLSDTQKAQLLIARAIAGRPRLLLVDGLLDIMTPEVAQIVWLAISDKEAPWTLMVVTNRPEIAALCDVQIELKGH